MIVFFVAASVMALTNINGVSSQTMGYEMMYERCDGNGYQKRCRWNDAASCNISDQTSCGGGGGGPIQ